MIEAVVSTRRHYPDVEVHVVMRGTAGALDEQAESAGADLIVYLDGEPASHDDQHSRAVASRVERALTGEGIYAVYQPIMNLRTGRVVGLEAFARFRDGAGVSPRDRLEEAQTVGLRRELELAAVLASVDQIELLPAAWFLAVNLSPATLMWSEFLDRLDELPLGRMWVEVNVRDEPTAWFERFSDLWPDGVRPPADGPRRHRRHVGQPQGHPPARARRGEGGARAGAGHRPPARPARPGVDHRRVRQGGRRRPAGRRGGEQGRGRHARRASACAWPRGSCSARPIGSTGSGCGS